MIAKLVKKFIQIQLRYFPSDLSEPENGWFDGGVDMPKKIEQMEIWVEPEQHMDPDSDDLEFHDTGRDLIRMSGSRKSYEELGKFFLGMAQFETPDPHHYQYLEGFAIKQGQREVIFQVNILQDKPVKFKNVNLKNKSPNKAKE